MQRREFCNKLFTHCFVQSSPNAKTHASVLYDEFILTAVHHNINGVVGLFTAFRGPQAAAVTVATGNHGREGWGGRGNASRCATVQSRTRRDGDATNDQSHANEPLDLSSAALNVKLPDSSLSCSAVDYG